MNQRNVTLEELFAIVERSISRGEYIEAKKILSSIVQNFPNNKTAKKRLKHVEHKLSKKKNLDIPVSEKNILVQLYSQGNIQELQKKSIELYQFYPGSFFLLNILGMIHQLYRDYDKAILFFQKCIDINPSAAEIYNNLGIAFFSKGEFQKSINAYKKALHFRNNYPEAYYNLGNVIKNSDPKEAINLYKKAIELNPNYLKAYNNLGSLLKELGDFSLAKEYYLAAIKINHNYAEAYYSLASLYSDLKDYDNAIKNFQEAISKNINYRDAYNDLGSIYREISSYSEAIECFQKAIAIDSNAIDCYLNLGKVYGEIYQEQKALELFHNGLKIQNNNEELYELLGAMYATLGDKTEANRYYKKSIEVNKNYGKSYLGLSSTQSVEEFSEYKVSIEEIIDNSSKEEKVFLHYALSNYYEKLEEYDNSFNHLEKANEYNRELVDFNLQERKDICTNIKKLFSLDFLTNSEITLQKASDKKIVFVLGMPRSGTSLTEQILSSHSKVFGAGELEFVRLGVLKNFKKIVESIDEFNELSRKFYEDYQEKLNILDIEEEFVVDKMPNNFMFIGFILKAFPNAKIVNLNRDPMAVSWSIYKTYFPSEGLGYSYNFKDLAGFYRLYSDMMAFWREKFPNQIYDISYEELTRNQESETKKLLEYCEFEWEEQCLDFHKNRRSVKTASNQQVRKKMYQNSSEKWKKFEKQLEPLKNLLIENNILNG